MVPLTAFCGASGSVPSVIGGWGRGCLSSNYRLCLEPWLPLLTHRPNTYPMAPEGTRYGYTLAEIQPPSAHTCGGFMPHCYALLCAPAPFKCSLVQINISVSVYALPSWEPHPNATLTVQYPVGTSSLTSERLSALGRMASRCFFLPWGQKTQT